MEYFTFPSRERLLAYLEAHPRVGKEKNQYLSEKGILWHITGELAERTLNPFDIGVAIGMVLHDLNKIFKLPDVRIMTIYISIHAALEDLYHV